MPVTTGEQFRCLKHLSEVELASGQAQHPNHDFLIFTQGWCFQNRSLQSDFNPIFTPQQEIFRRASGLYYMASDLKCSGHKQMSTKCSSLLANYEAYPSLPAHQTQTPPGGTRGWQYWGAQETWKGYLVPNSMKKISNKWAGNSPPPFFHQK